MRLLLRQIIASPMHHMPTFQAPGFQLQQRSLFVAVIVAVLGGLRALGAWVVQLVPVVWTNAPQRHLGMEFEYMFS